MRAAGKIVAEILSKLKNEIQPGITTLYLDSISSKLALEFGSVPAFKGYNGYPFSLCCSVNEQVVHGLPSKRKLKSGDIVSIDFGVVYNGFYGDAAITVPVGRPSAEAERLIQVTERALDLAIEKAQPGNRLLDISFEIQNYVESHGFSVVKDFVGHGIGKNLHESPQVPNFGHPGRGIVLKEGLVLAIEPMINEKEAAVRILNDGWTAVTKDGGLSAHFEHTVAITSNGPVILTK
jgi:methionyl aminopeptidase